jgi:predicted phosphodiesterase
VFKPSSFLPCRRRTCAGTIVAFAYFALIVGAGEQDVTRTFLKGPYLQAPGADTMTIMWESPTSRPGIVRYGLKGKFDREVRLETPRPLEAVWPMSVTNVAVSGKTNVTEISNTNVVFLYEMTLTNLRPNSVYTYAAETDGVPTPPRNFKTFGAHPDKVRFIAYGDTRTNPKTHTAIAANFKRHSPDFILHTGDLVAAGKRYDLWGREFFGPLAQVIDEVPILPAIGNHEQDGINYLRYLRLPGKELWYSYDVGPVHVLSLDFRSEKESDEQFAFARQDLMAATAPWKIVFLHYPVFNIGGHGTGWGHDAYLPLFHQAKVDLVMAGHSHIYERFRPIAPRTGTNTWPITHITTGGGGAPLYVVYPHPALEAQVSTNHFVLIEATPTSLTGRALTTNETVIDKFELKKSSGQPTVKYLAQVYPEETLKLSSDAIASLMAELASMPATNSSAQVMFTIRAMKTAKEPVELEIGLTSDSARHYEFEGSPPRVTTPFGIESNKVVWANVRATGLRRIETTGTNRFLVPALVFQARVKAGTDVTFAYGQKCKVSDAAAAAAKRLAEAQPSK